MSGRLFFCIALTAVARNFCKQAISVRFPFAPFGDFGRNGDFSAVIKGNQVLLMEHRVNTGQDDRLRFWTAVRQTESVVFLLA
jgi:hypothetical protein